MNKDNSFASTSAGIGTMLVIAFVCLIIAPFLVFWLSYVGGIIAQFVIGKVLVDGLALIGINIGNNQIPLLAGTLGWLGSFFKGVGRISSREN